MTFFIIDAIVCGLIGTGLGAWKNQWWRGALAGLVLGPIGLLVMLVIPVSEEARVRRASQRLAAEQEAARRMSGQA